MIRSLAAIKDFFGAVRGGLKNVVNAEEIFRSIVASFGAGGLVGLAITILTAVLAHAAVIFPNPAVAALATTVITLVVDLLRRLSHGDEPAPEPVPSPNPGPAPAPAPKPAKFADAEVVLGVAA